VLFVSGHKRSAYSRVAVSCPGRKPKGIAPFLQTVDNTRPPFFWVATQFDNECEGVATMRKKQVYRNPRLSVVLPPPVYEELWQRADSNDVSAAWIIRRALEHYFGGGPKGSVRNIAAEKLTAKPTRNRQDQHRALRHY
jgi:hypothetical protein